MIALTACAGCHNQGVNDVNALSGRSAKDWTKNLPDSVDWSVWDRKLERTQWEFVVESEELNAESLLQTTSYVALSDDQLTKLVPGRQAAGTPYLVRAVTAAWPRTIGTTAGIEVHVSKNWDLWVAGGALSHRTVPIERSAIIVWLPQPPHEVYVTFGVAE